MEERKIIEKAIRIAKENPNNFGMGILQKKLKLGVIKCSRLLDILENEGVIGKYNPKSHLREVLIDNIN